MPVTSSNHITRVSATDRRAESKNRRQVGIDDERGEQSGLYAWWLRFVVGRLCHVTGSQTGQTKPCLQTDPSGALTICRCLTLAPDVPSSQQSNRQRGGWLGLMGTLGGGGCWGRRMLTGNNVRTCAFGEGWTAPGRNGAHAGTLSQVYHYICEGLQTSKISFMCCRPYHKQQLARKAVDTSNLFPNVHELKINCCQRWMKNLSKLVDKNIFISFSAESKICY